MSTLESLRSLVEHGVARRFDLRAWADRTGCAQPTALERLEAMLEQARPDALKLIVMESLVDTPARDLDTMVYGETKVRPFLNFLNAHAARMSRENRERGIESPEREKYTFYDLGSGAGKSILTAALSPHFIECRGVECLPCVHAVSEILIDDFHRDVAPRDDGVSPRVSALLGDVFVDDAWTSADFVFCNCVTWDAETMRRLSTLAERMRPGSTFVTVLCPLESDAFETVAEDELEFSWGVVDALVHRRLEFAVTGVTNASS